MNFACLLLAAIDDLPPPDLGNLTATAILGWYAWHTASRTIPGLLADFRAELAARRTECAADREAFRRELAEERTQRHADNLSIVETLQRLATQGEGLRREA